MALPRRKQTRLLRVEARSGAQASDGQPLNEWKAVLEAWVNPSGQNGLTSIGQMHGDVPASVSRYSFRLDYRPDLNDAMRAILGGQPYDIVQVRHDHAGRQWTDLVCEFGGNDG